MRARKAHPLTPGDRIVQERHGAAWVTLAVFPWAGGAGWQHATAYARALHRLNPVKSYRMIKGAAKRRPAAKRRIRRNPASRVDAFDAYGAAKLYRRFAGKEAISASKTRKPDIPDAMACIGRVSVIQYIAERDGETNEYRHPFKARSRPHLCVSPDGKLVLMLGGAFTFTEDGFVDEPSR